MNNISQVSKAYMCSNCGACKAICPKDCIEFCFSSIGRMFATVDDKYCIDCGLCTKVCPSLDKAELHNLFNDHYVGTLKKVYVGRCSDEYYYKNAQSGGVCTALLAYMFDNNLIDAAVVTRMFYGITPIVKSVIVTRKEDLYETQKSCYTPVDIVSTLRETKQYKSVAVVGLPCHIQGIVSLKRISKRFLNIKYLIGLICDKTLCKSIQEVMISYSPIDNEECLINWRKKDFTYNKIHYPYKSAPIVISYKDIDYLHILPNYYRFALKEMFTPPRCRVCYDKINVFADIVLGDPWRMENTDEKRGASVIAVRTDVGMNLINLALNNNLLKLEERNIQQIIDGQLIQERRKSVAVYSHAINSLPNQINSYLYKQNSDSLYTKKEIEMAKEQVQMFINNDNESIDEIIVKSNKVIDKWLKTERNNIIVRIVRKLKRILI